MLSIPGIGPGIAATISGEASRLIRDRDYHAFRCYAGTAPVTKQSAKRKTVNMRYACSSRLRQAMHHWANRSIICDSRSRQHYGQLRAAGHHHARAVRGLADRLIGLLIAMLENGERYDSTRRMPLDPSLRQPTTLKAVAVQASPVSRFQAATHFSSNPVCGARCKPMLPTHFWHLSYY
jgi:hypothetical protein